MIWRHDMTYTSNPKMTRDPSGNFYVAYPQSSYSSFSLRVDKVNPLGTLVWSQVVAASISNTGRQFSVRKMIYAHDKVYILFHDRAEGGTGSFGQAYLRYVDPVQGWSNQINASNIEYEGLASYANGVALAGFAYGKARLYRLGALGGNTGSAEVDGFDRVDDLACAPDGTAYLAATKADGTVAMIKVNPDDSYGIASFDNATRTSEKMTRIMLDTSTNRVYGVGTGLYNGVITDVDVMLYAMNTNLTNPISGGYGGVNVESPGDIVALPGGDIAVTYFSDTPTPDATVVRRFTSNLGSVWNTSISEAVPNTPRLAFDADGNLLIYDNRFFDEDHFMRVTKKAAAGGATLETTTYKRTTLTTLEFLSDAAGNYYCTSSEGLTGQLYRFQPARLNLTQNTIPGGGTISAFISLSSVASTDQTWTLASANPAAASVPANVVVTNGTNGAAFNITTSAVAANMNIGISARYQGFIMQKTLTLLTPTVSSLSISPNVVVGGVNTAGLVTISAAAPTGGKTVTLASSNTAAATVPASVVIPAGSTTFGFGITTYGVTANRGVVITATTGAISRTAFFAVNAPSLVSVSMNPSTIKGGLQSAMTVTLDGVAPTGGRSVVIFSGAPGIVFAPASVTVAAGQTSITQNLNTAAVTSSTNVLIFATRSGIYKTTTLTVTP